jgi:hypothetical protein
MAKTSMAEQLRKKAEYFNEIAEKLNAAAEALEMTEVLNGVSSYSVDPKSSRIEQIAAFLREHGPLTRTAIFRALDGSMPRGTLSVLLNATNFSKDSDGKWSVREEKKSK